MNLVSGALSRKMLPGSPVIHISSSQPCGDILPLLEGLAVLRQANGRRDRVGLVVTVPESEFLHAHSDPEGSITSRLTTVGVHVDWHNDGRLCDQLVDVDSL